MQGIDLSTLKSSIARASKIGISGIDLSTLKSSITRAPRIHLYGVSGIGKTTFAYQMPKPFVFDLDKSIGTLGYGDKIPHVSDVTYETMIKYLENIIDGDYDFQTIIIDTIDRLDDIIVEYTLRVNHWDKMDYGGYGNKFTVKSSYWQKIFTLLDEIWTKKNLCIVTIGHSKVVSVNEPNLPAYEKYGFATLSKTEVSHIENTSDIVAFVNTKKFSSYDDNKRVNISTTNERLMFLNPSPAYIAKSRYPIPDGIPLDWNTFKTYLVRQ